VINIRCPGEQTGPKNENKQSLRRRVKTVPGGPGGEDSDRERLHMGGEREKKKKTTTPKKGRRKKKKRGKRQQKHCNAIPKTPRRIKSVGKITPRQKKRKGSSEKEKKKVGSRNRSCLQELTPIKKPPNHDERKD